MYKRTIIGALLAAVALASAPAPAAPELREKTVNLDIALRTAALLRDAGVTVVGTRWSDVSRSPAQRTWVAARYDADLYVSLHNNWSPRRSDSYAAVFSQLRGGGSRTAAAAISRAFDAAFGSPARVATRRGQHGDYYFQLRLNRMPAVIVESAFVSNPEQARALARSPAYRQQIAAAVADGILTWQRTLGQPPPHMDAPAHRIATPFVPAPSRASAMALDRNDVWLRWTGASDAGAYRIYRDGVAIAAIERSPSASDVVSPSPVAMSFVDRWAAPGQRYRYEIVAAAADPLSALESAPAHATTSTPAITVCVDAGHGGGDPGAIAAL